MRCKINMNSEYVRILKMVVRAYFKVLCWKTTEDLSKWPIVLLKIKLVICQLGHTEETQESHKILSQDS